MMAGLAVALPIYELVGPDKRLHRVRAVHGRLDVDHGVPRARADPRRAADAQAADRRAGARQRRDRRHLRLVPDRARHRGRRGRLGLRGGARRSLLAIAFCVRDARRSSGACSAACRPPTTRPAACPSAWIVAIFAGVLLSAFTDRGDRHRADLRRLRDGRGHAAPRRADRGRHPPHRGLRRLPAAAAVLLLHRACAPTCCCSTASSCWLLTVALLGGGDRRASSAARCWPRASPGWAGASRRCSGR